MKDPYRWLERADDPDVRKWVQDEDSLTRNALDKFSSREALKKRLGELLYSGSVDQPKRGGARYFFTSRKAGQEQSVLYVRDPRDGKDRTLLDPNTWPKADARAFQNFWPANDGRKLVVATSLNNADCATFQVLDVDSGAISDQIDGIYDSEATWSPSGSPSGDGFYYRWSPSNKAYPLPDLPAHAEVRFHRLGSPVSTDRIIRHATGDAHVTEYVTAASDKHWLLLHVQRGFTRHDVLALDLRKIDSTWTVLAAHDDVWNDAIEANDVFYVKTDDGASRGRVVRVDPKYPDRRYWTELVGERPDATLAKMRVVGHRLVLLWRKDDVPELETCALDGSDRRRIALPGVGFLSGLDGTPEDESAFAEFESYTVPPEVLEIDPHATSPHVWQRVQSPIDADAYVTEEKFFLSKDGARIPIFIIRRRDVHPSGNAPTVYWGYGGFGTSLTLNFAPEMLPWLDRGGIYAEAGIRGGGDYGQEWHRAGMRTHKQNVIDDYIAGARALIDWKWTSANRLMACGASNGGLLVGAAIVQRPDLFGAAFIAAPLLDMVRYPLFGNGQQWTAEYGSPENVDELRALLSYSPYHNVKNGVRYPSVLVYSPDSDDRVDPMHARKFVAVLQEASSGGPVLLSIAKSEGHAGPAGVEPMVEEYADAYAFGLHAMGLDQPAGP